MVMLQRHNHNKTKQKLSVYLIGHVVFAFVCDTCYLLEMSYIKSYGAVPKHNMRIVFLPICSSSFSKK